MTSYEMSRSVACLPYAATSYQFVVVSGMKEQLWEAVLAADPQALCNYQDLMAAFVQACSVLGYSTCSTLLAFTSFLSFLN